MTMRLGMMHLAMAFIGSIGTLFGDGGLSQMLSGSDVYADATVGMMLQGKQYSRGLRGIKLVHEALLHLFFTAAEHFAKENNLPWFDDDTLQLIDDLDNALKVCEPSAATAVTDELEKNT